METRGIDTVAQPVEYQVDDGIDTSLEGRLVYPDAAPENGIWNPVVVAPGWRADVERTETLAEEIGAEGYVVFHYTFRENGVDMMQDFYEKYPDRAEENGLHEAGQVVADRFYPWIRDRYQIDAVPPQTGSYEEDVAASIDAVYDTAREHGIQLADELGMVGVSTGAWRTMCFDESEAEQDVDVAARVLINPYYPEKHRENENRPLMKPGTYAVIGEEDDLAIPADNIEEMLPFLPYEHKHYADGGHLMLLDVGHRPYDPYWPLVFNRSPLSPGEKEEAYRFITDRLGEHLTATPTPRHREADTLR